MKIIIGHLKSQNIMLQVYIISKSICITIVLPLRFYEKLDTKIYYGKDDEFDTSFDMYDYIKKSK